MGVSTYFWPCLPVTGSPKTVEALSKLCMRIRRETDRPHGQENGAAGEGGMILKVFNRIADPSAGDHPWTDWKK